MSSGIVLEMENICGNTEPHEDFLWWLRRKPQLLGDAVETTHSASRRVAEKIKKCLVTVNIRGKSLRIPRSVGTASRLSRGCRVSRFVWPGLSLARGT